MSKYYTIEHVNGITRIQFSKNPTYNEVQSVIDDIAENFPYIKRLWVFSNIKFDLSVDEIKAIAKYGKSKFIKPNKLAIVAPDDRAFFKLHIFQAHRKQKEHSVANVFRTEQEALEWLRQ